MLFIFLLGLFLFPEVLKEASLYLHGICLNQSPSTAYSDLYQGIVCGKNLDKPSWFHLFATTGLIHILVVSGSHLNELQKWARWFRIPPFLIQAFLILYSFICLLEPPVIRAIIYGSVTELNSRKRLQWAAWQCHLVTIVVALISSPKWFSSLSFQLSLLCGLALSLPYKDKELFIYLILVPLLACLGNYHPLTIVLNMSLGLLLGVILFPLSALAFFIPSLSFFTDYLWKVILQLLTFFSSIFHLSTDKLVSYDSQLSWLYIVGVILFLKKVEHDKNTII